MEKLKSYLKASPYIIFLGLTIFGYWHVNKKHSDRTINLCEWIFPIASYYGLEYFWHDDFAGVDWNERHERDMKMISYFFTRYEKDSAKFQLTKDIQDFSNEIKSYPPEELIYLKSGAKELMLMTTHLTYDMINFSENYLKGETSDFIFSDLTNDHLTKLKTKYHIYTGDEMNTSKLNIQMQNSLRKMNPTSENLEILKENFESYLSDYKNAYKDIFKEEYLNTEK